MAHDTLFVLYFLIGKGICMKNVLKSQVLLAISLVFSFHVYGAQSVPESVPGEYVVKLKAQSHLESLPKTLLSQQLKGFVKGVIPSQNIVVIKKAVMESTESAIKTLNMNPMVETAEPNFIYRINKMPNDPMLGQLWGLSNIGQKDSDGAVGTAGIDINAEKAWEIQTGSRDVVVAVIDTGVDYTHADLKENMWTNDAELNGKTGVDDDGNGVIDDIYGYNAVLNNGDPKDDHGHGSHCAGTIGAKGDNGIGVSGINWNVRIMALKFLAADGSGTLENALRAIDYATKMGAHIESNSWGGGGFSQTLLDAIQRSNDAGVLFVAAAGNEYNNNDAKPTYPATYAVPNIIAVAAINNKGGKADFSNFGKKTVHIGAPGVNIISTTGGAYDSFSGTSMAAPHISGVAALLKANEPSLTALEIKQRMIATAHPIKSLSGKTYSGGYVDAYAALMNTTPPPDQNDPANWSSKEVSVKSESPYAASTNQTFDVSVDGAKEIALYFSKFNTEAGYDVLSIYDSAGVKIQDISGLNDDIYSLTITGSAAKLVFKSDKSVEKSGWEITKVSYR